MKCQILLSVKNKKSVFNVVSDLLGRTMRKCVYGLMRTAKAQISLRIRAISSEQSLSLNRSIGYYRMFQRSVNAGMRLSKYAGWCESAHFAHAGRHVFAWRGPYDSGLGNILLKWFENSFMHKIKLQIWTAFSGNLYTVQLTVAFKPSSHVLRVFHTQHMAAWLEYSWTPTAQTFFGPWKFILDMGTLSH